MEYGYGLIAALVAFLGGLGIGSRRKASRKALPAPAVEVPDVAEAPKRTSQDFEKLLEAAGFRVGLLGARSGRAKPKGSFEGTYFLRLGTQNLDAVCTGMEGWRLAYALTSERSQCKYCKRYGMMYRLSEVTASTALAETCLACWNCGWIMHDRQAIDRCGLATVVADRTNVYPVLDELMQGNACLNAKARLRRARVERAELGRLCQVLDDEIAGLEKIVEAEAAPGRT